MSDGFNSVVDDPSKHVGLGGTLERQTVAAAASLPVMKCWRRTSVRQIIRYHTEQHQLNKHRSCTP